MKSQRKGGGVEYKTSFVSAVQYDDYVRVTFDRNGEQQELTAAFVVGCDGSHSAIRHFLELPFEGEQYKASFLLADIETNNTLPADEMQLCPSEFGPLAIFPMSSTRRRIVATIDLAQGDAPSLDLVRNVLTQRGPSSIEAYSLIWSSYFRIHHRQVTQMRIGRIFVAGDAAHIHSPFGGQGMNTGLHDAWNLIWKLDLVLRGHGSKQLLDSYTSERFPIIKQVISLTDFMTKAMGTPSKIAQTLRNTIIPVVSRLAPFQHGIVQRLSQLGIAYGGSPIVEGPGKRYLHDFMRSGNGISSRFIVIVDSNTDASIINELRQFCESHHDIIELKLIPGQSLLLIRPDGYIAYENENSEVDIAHLCSVLKRHVIMVN